MGAGRQDPGARRVALQGWRDLRLRNRGEVRDRRACLHLVDRADQREGGRKARRLRAKGEGGAGRMGVHRRRPSGLGDQRVDVFDLALDRVRRGVAAVASAPSIVVEHGEALGEFLGCRSCQSPIAELPTHHDNGWTVAQPIVGDRRAVARSHRSHRGTLLRPTPTLVYSKHMAKATRSTIVSSFAKVGGLADTSQSTNFVELRSCEVPRMHHAPTSGSVKLHSLVTALGQQRTEAEPRRLGVVRLRYLCWFHADPAQKAVLNVRHVWNKEATPSRMRWWLWILIGGQLPSLRWFSNSRRSPAGS